MKFWDSSALVTLCVEEPATDAALALLKDDPQVAIWWTTPVECASAIARLERDGCLAGHDPSSVAQPGAAAGAVDATDAPAA